jgi:preprotein translocase subunit Sec61beta
VLVLGLAAAAGLAVFWGRVGWESLRKSRRPRLVLAASVAFVALLVLLTVLGVKLPHE